MGEKCRALRTARPSNSPNYATDIDNQDQAANYTYDSIGNLKSDAASKLTGINWTVYGKIADITNTSGTIYYTYDAAGNRITKTANGTTWVYVRDAQGNVMTIYKDTASALIQSEIDLYGSSRLGLIGPLTVAPTYVRLTGGDSAILRTFTRGEKSYELSNHLGNVLATITDKKIGVSSSPDSSLIDHYVADVATAQDYYPFGMLMPNRTYTGPIAGNYRYGFNGKENDNEVKGVGDQIDYGMRVYDPRIGRFLSVDPLTAKYPWYTPYQYAGNTPIWAIDVDGLEEAPTTKGTKEGQVQSTSKFIITGPRGTGHRKTIDWHWHAGSAEYGTKAGWYTPEDYEKVLTPIARDFAEYEGMLKDAASVDLDHNWTESEKLNLVNTKLGRFIGAGLSESASVSLANSAKTFADGRNFNVTGQLRSSFINSEDFVFLVGGLLKGGIKALGEVFAKSEIERINLASAQRTIHILAGDATGGGHS